MTAAKQKRVAWLDTVRVFASLTIIVSHFFMLKFFWYTHQTLVLSLACIGHVGVFLFFAISGYLASNSLKHSKNVWEFYRRKLIRIVIPFTTAYVVLGIFFIMLGILEPSLAKQSPFYHILYKGGNYLSILFSIFPWDQNLRRFLSSPEYLNLPSYWFVGEWFIGTVVWLYLITPILDKLLKKNFFVTAITTIAVSLIVYFNTTWMESNHGRGLINWFIFLVRTPEFLIGMVIFVYRDFILKYRSILIKFSILIVLTYSIYIFAFTSDVNPEYPIFPIFYRLCYKHPSSFIFSLPFIYLLFTFAEWLNKKFSGMILEKFNSLSEISYMAMLIQHVIIYLFARSFDFEKLSKFGVWLMLTLITLTIVVTSFKIRNIYKPIEEWCIKNFLKRK